MGTKFRDKYMWGKPLSPSQTDVQRALQKLAMRSGWSVDALFESAWSRGEHESDINPGGNRMSNEVGGPCNFDGTNPTDHFAVGFGKY